MAEVKNFTLPIVAGLLVIAAFFIGSLWTKIQYLEKGTVQGTQKTVGQQPEQNPQEPTQPEEQPALNASDVPPISDQDHVQGSQEAKVTLIEYSDFQCPYCKSFHPTLKQVMADYAGKVKWVYRHFPLSSIHPFAQKAAEASECVSQQGGNEAFWKFSDALFSQEDLSVPSLKQIALDQGLDTTAFNECLDSDKFAQKVQDDMAGGQKLGVRGTPGTVLMTDDGKTELISGALPLANLKQTIDKYLGQ